MKLNPTPTLPPSCIHEVIRAAATKPFGFVAYTPGPGLGGHCIPIDPFYLAWKAREYGVNTRFMELAGEVNRAMPEWVVNKIAQALNERGKAIKGSKILVLGLAFKENTPDLRNSRVIDVIHELRSYGVEVFVHDPVVSPHDAKEEYGIELAEWQDLPSAAATILAVAHKAFLARPISDFASKTQRGGCLVDVKAKLDPQAVQEHGLKLWRL